MKINRPRRVLMLGKPNCGILELLKGSAPTPVDGSLAGLSHVWDLETDYYEVDLPIWVDEVSDMSAWEKDFLRPEAQEVTAAVGAWIYCFRRPVTDEDLKFLRQALDAIMAVLENVGDDLAHPTLLAVATPQSTTPHLEKTIEEWEAICSDCGFEYVDSEAKGRNKYGEALGVERIREALETTEWESEPTLDMDELGGMEGESPADFDIELTEMNRELLQMKTSLGDGDDDNDDGDENDQESKVENLTSMMASLQAIRDTGAMMPEQQRKVFAAQAVNKLMKNL